MCLRKEEDSSNISSNKDIFEGIFYCIFSDGFNRRIVECENYF